jgi:hypothetical protein
MTEGFIGLLDNKVSRQDKKRLFDAFLVEVGIRSIGVYGIRNNCIVEAAPAARWGLFD